MEIDTYIKQLRRRLARCPLTRDQLAERTGGDLSASWLSKFAAGVMDNPRAETLKSLDAALTHCEREGA